MILSPTVIALQILSLLTTLLLVGSAWLGVQILRHWDIASGSELQLVLERRTYLASTLLGNVLIFQLLALFLFIATADWLSPLLVGAMCAVGTLHANPFGFPALGLKLCCFLLSGLWLLINRADNLGHDYPLIRVKYALLLVLAPLSVAETILQALFFAGLTPDIITSCCGSLFSSPPPATSTDLQQFPPRLLLGLAGTMTVCIIGLGIWLRQTGRGGPLLAVACLAYLPVALGTIVAAVSPYIYELPTHHCPFCLLQGEYTGIGYLLYGALLIVTVCGTAGGLLSRWLKVPSLRERLPALQQRLALATVISALVLLAGAVLTITGSNLQYG